MDDFHPDCVFLSFSDDFFIPQIALYVAQRYNIPIVSSIGDDYFFNDRFSISPIYHIYKTEYKKLIRKVLAYKGSAIYISDKIRDKYNTEFGLDGKTVYLTSEIRRREFRTINLETPVITYFGNIRIGRNYALNDIAFSLGKIDRNYVLRIYSGENDRKYYSIFEKNPYAEYCGSISYAEVQEKMTESDITIIVEGFNKKDIDQSRYSLSTKAADTLASGVSILTYGSQECGIVEYMQSTNASAVCTDKKKLKETIMALLDDIDLQKQYYINAEIVTEKHHNLKQSCAVFESVVESAIQKGDNACLKFNIVDPFVRSIFRLMERTNRDVKSPLERSANSYGDPYGYESAQLFV